MARAASEWRPVVREGRPPFPTGAKIRTSGPKDRWQARDSVGGPAWRLLDQEYDES